MIEKIPHTIGNQIFPLKCGFGIGYGIGRKYQPIWVSVLVSDRNQNSGFGRTLPQRYTDLALWRVMIFCKESLSVISVWPQLKSFVSKLQGLFFFKLSNTSNYSVNQLELNKSSLSIANDKLAKWFEGALKD